MINIWSIYDEYMINIHYIYISLYINVNVIIHKQYQIMVYYDYNIYIYVCVQTMWYEIWFPWCFKAYCVAIYLYIWRLRGLEACHRNGVIIAPFSWGPSPTLKNIHAAQQISRHQSNISDRFPSVFQGASGFYIHKISWKLGPHFFLIWWCPSYRQAALGGTNYIDHLILCEDILNLHLLLKETHHEVNLCCQAGIPSGNLT